MADLLDGMSWPMFTAGLSLRRDIQAAEVAAKRRKAVGWLCCALAVMDPFASGTSGSSMAQMTDSAMKGLFGARAARISGLLVVYYAGGQN
jgi:hypothetical protein